MQLVEIKLLYMNVFKCTLFTSGSKIGLLCLCVSGRGVFFFMGKNSFEKVGPPCGYVTIDKDTTLYGIL